MKPTGFFLLTLAALPTAGRAAEPPRPNILLICTDEMRWDVMGCAGHPMVKTPNLDKLAAGATRYAVAYTPGPICMPSRRSLFTGRYPHVHGVTNNGRQCLANDGEVDLPTLLKHYGYTTGLAGKLHFAPPENDWSFDSFWSFGNEGPHKLRTYPQYVNEKYGGQALRPVPGSQPYPNDPLGRDLGRVKIAKEDYQTYWITDRSIDFLHEQKATGKPFFFFTSYKEPHSPYCECEPYASMYDPAKINPPPIPGWVTRARKDAIANNEAGPSRHLIDDPAMEKALTAAYYGHMTNVDDNVGRLLAEVERLGLTDNTIVAFTSDHGNMLGDLGRWFKGVMYEGSSRIPLMVRAPARSPHAAAFNRGKVVNEIVENIDVLPTLFEMIGLPIPAGVQGRSLIALTSGKAEGWKNRAFAERTTMMVRDGRYKLIRNRHPDAASGSGAYELYDLETDPKEEHDLAAAPEQRDRVKRLAALLDAWQKDRPPPIRVEGLTPPKHLFLDAAARKQFLATKKADD